MTSARWLKSVGPSGMPARATLQNAATLWPRRVFGWNGVLGRVIWTTAETVPYVRSAADLGA